MLHTPGTLQPHPALVTTHSPKSQKIIFFTSIQGIEMSRLYVQVFSYQSFDSTSTLTFYKNALTPLGARDLLCLLQKANTVNQKAWLKTNFFVCEIKPLNHG